MRFKYYITTIHILCLFCSIGIAQITEIETINTLGNNDPKLSSSEKPASQPVIISAEIIKISNDTITFKIFNPDLSTELYYNQAKRDALTALPGITELSLSSVDQFFTVSVKRYYAEKYLQTQFDICEKEASTLLNNKNE